MYVSRKIERSFFKDVTSATLISASDCDRAIWLFKLDMDVSYPESVACMVVIILLINVIDVVWEEVKSFNIIKLISI